METEQNCELFCSLLSRGKAVIHTQSSSLFIWWLPTPHCHPFPSDMHPAPRFLVPAESAPRCLQLHHLLEDKKVHSSERMWIHLCHLRSLPSPALVFTELTCVYLYSCPPVFTVLYLPHVCPETPSQAGLHTESLLGTSTGKKEAIWCRPLPPGLNGISHPQNPQSTVSDLRSTHLAGCSLECLSEFQSL